MRTYKIAVAETGYVGMSRGIVVLVKFFRLDYLNTNIT